MQIPCPTTRLMSGLRMQMKYEKYETLLLFCKLFGIFVYKGLQYLNCLTCVCCLFPAYLVYVFVLSGWNKIIYDTFRHNIFTHLITRF